MGNFSFNNPYNVPDVDVTEQIYLNPTLEGYYGAVCSGFVVYTLNRDVPYQGLYAELKIGKDERTLQLMQYGPQSSPTSKGARFFFPFTYYLWAEFVLFTGFQPSGWGRTVNLPYCGLPGPQTLFGPSHLTITPVKIPFEQGFTIVDVNYDQQLANFDFSQGYPTDDVGDSGFIPRAMVQTNNNNLTSSSAPIIPRSTLTASHWHPHNHPLPSEDNDYGLAHYVYSATFLNNFQDKVSDIQVYLYFHGRQIQCATFKENFTRSAEFSGGFSYKYQCAIEPPGCAFSVYITTKSEGTYYSNFTLLSATTLPAPFQNIEQGVTQVDGKVITAVSRIGNMSIGDQYQTGYLEVYPRGITSTFNQEYNYPVYFRGNLKDGSYYLPYTFPTDMPSCQYQLNYEHDRIFTNQRDLKIIDLTPPLVHLTLLYPSEFNPSYRVQVDVSDAIGIGEKTCSLIVGEDDDYNFKGDVYPLNSGSRIADIRGNMFKANSNDYCINKTCNELTNVFSGLPSCDVSTVKPVYLTQLRYLGYSYGNGSTIMFNAVLGGTNKFNTATLCLYEDFDNKILSNLSCTLLTMNKAIDGSSLGSYILSGAITVYPHAITKTYYFGLNYSIDAAQPTITLSSRDISYFAIQRSQQYPNNLITIRNSDFQPLPNDLKLIIVENPTLDITIQLSKQKITMLGAGPLGMLKNVTVVVHDNFKPGTLTNVTWTNDPSAPSFLPLNITTVKTWGRRMLAYISQVCDYHENCEQYPMFGYYSQVDLVKSFQPDTIVSNPLSGTSIKFGTANIDAARVTKTPFNITFTSTNPLNCSTLDPILILTEMGSQDYLTFHTDHCSNQGGSAGNGYVFTGTMSTPFGWGLRGVTSSVWNIVDRYGHSTGFHSADPAPMFELNEPFHIDQSILDYYHKTINITGSGLYVDYNLNGQSIKPTMKDTNTAIIPFGSFIPFLEKNNYITIGGIQVLLDFYYCHSLNCSGHGKCVENKCQCDKLWQGEDCSINKNYFCPNNCSGNGDCVDQNCMCLTGFAGPTCNLTLDQVKVDMNYKEDMSTAILGVSNGANLTKDTLSVSYHISIVSILEMSYTDTVVNNITLNWKLASSSANSTKYTISNMDGIQDASNTITLTIDKFMDGGQTTWANKTFNFQPNTVKYTVSFDGYNFTSQLNYIQIIFETVSMGDCAQQQNENITWGAASLQDMHYFVIPQHQIQCYGRFPTSVISDGRILALSNKIISSKEPVQIATTVPFFKKSAMIDPDFSVLVSYSQTNGNDGQCQVKVDGMKPYVIPLIVVGCVIFVAIIGVVLYMSLKRNIYIRHRIHQFKSRNNLSSSSSNKLDKM
ncbi:hypothetical protein SAMD00019534_089090 [Acytostelium subglobosum LB1]|uniref:hypothetical protein n=1 Tax=Acytostelium subglobosum LB1 TaxID=1410327 RepID=UPI000644A628|nr:hypothetical protein SAMD00019534_089090 [Acytostelium subglobosum LB1]GAM25734.1 hypothetical protein SAMD00019534_089090 [Acytostelium subglobosum LB1]|eukprot:XP_012751252.1 hypothetical protein SAMD00019534_089090 [Acytostelium subglobosum LB1]